MALRATVADGDEILKVPEERAQVPPALARARVDQAAAQLFPSYSRSLLARWIEAGALTVDGAGARPKQRLHGGEELALRAEQVPFENWSEPQPLPLTLLYEDEHLLIVNKAPGRVVHPGAGNPDGTLVNALLSYRSSQQQLPRAGIVHRLDKDTSGLMVVAASLPAQTALTAAIAARQVERHYLAVARGDLAQPQLIDAPVGRDPRVPTRQAVRSDGKPARTHVAVKRRFGCATQIEARLETGRTHQIRVHLQHLGHPLVGDPRYGAQRAVPGQRSLAQEPEGVRRLLSEFPRQALHAARLGLEHPVTQQPLQFEAEPPDDLATLLAQLDGLTQ